MNVRATQENILNFHSSSCMVDVVVYTQPLEQNFWESYLCQEWEDGEKDWLSVCIYKQQENRASGEFNLVHVSACSVCSDIVQQLHNFKGCSIILFWLLSFFSSYLYTIWIREEVSYSTSNANLSHPIHNNIRKIKTLANVFECLTSMPF